MEEDGLLGNISTYTRYLRGSQDVIENWGKFATLFVVGTMVIMVSLPFASFLLINPKPFCMMFSLGSMIILIAVLQVIQISSLMKQAGSFVASIVYLCSLGLSLYAGLVQVGYGRTIMVLTIQILSLLYVVVSQFPGGTKGMSLVASQVKSQAINTMQSIFGKQSSYLPL